MIKCFSLFRSKAGGGRKSGPELGRRRRELATCRKNKSTGSLTGIPEMSGRRKVEKKLRVFSLSELAEATSNFSRLLRIGQGGFGSVYKGQIMPENGARGPPTIVAIKKLNTQGLQGHKQWVAEVQFLGVVDHPNLVKLIGYCCAEGERGTQRLLVYEYMPRKSLEDHLFNRSAPVIPWTTRLRIILGAARGMTYLHEALENQVIHRDFKSSNVLLDEDFNAKLSDFGLAREGPTGDRTHVSTAPVGTPGYAAPEYIETGRLTAKSDIYSFGVVLYEILTGRRTLERNLPSPEQKLIEWVRQSPANTNRFVLIMDPRLQNAYDVNAARRIAQLADSCLSKNPRDRPCMSQVTDILKQALEDSTNTVLPAKTRKSPAAAVVVPGRIPQPAQA